MGSNNATSSGNANGDANGNNRQMSNATSTAGYFDFLENKLVENSKGFWCVFFVICF